MQSTTPPAAVQPAYLSDRDRFIQEQRMLAAIADDAPCNDQEWLESHADLLDRLPHDAARLAARALREIAEEMAYRGVWSVVDLEARRADALAVACEPFMPYAGPVPAFA